MSTQSRSLLVKRSTHNIKMSDDTGYAVIQHGIKKRQYSTGRKNLDGTDKVIYTRGGLTFVRTTPRRHEIPKSHHAI